MSDPNSTIRPQVVRVQTTPRPTAPSPSASFSEVLAGGAHSLMRGAAAAVRGLPGSPLMAVAVRGMSSGTSLTALSATPSSSPGMATGAVGVSPEGPGGVSPVASTGAGSTTTGTSATGTGSDGIESTMAQDQQMNLYYLQIQEQVNAQNRTFSALSNVIEVEHSTAKTAIGNIH